MTDLFLSPVRRLEELNVSWCDFSSEHVKSVIGNIPSDVTQLDISGYRQNLTMEGGCRLDLGGGVAIPG